MLFYAAEHQLLRWVGKRVRYSFYNFGVRINLDTELHVGVIQKHLEVTVCEHSRLSIDLHTLSNNFGDIYVVLGRNAVIDNRDGRVWVEHPQSDDVVRNLLTWFVKHVHDEKDVIHRCATAVMLVIGLPQENSG